MPKFIKRKKGKTGDYRLLFSENALFISGASKEPYNKSEIISNIKVEIKKRRSDWLDLGVFISVIASLFISFPFLIGAYLHIQHVYNFFYLKNLITFENTIFNTLILLGFMWIPTMMLNIVFVYIIEVIISIYFILRNNPAEVYNYLIKNGTFIQVKMKHTASFDQTELKMDYYYGFEFTYFRKTLRRSNYNRVYTYYEDIDNVKEIQNGTTLIALHTEFVSVLL
jgi:hypothetical protein